MHEGFDAPAPPIHHLPMPARVLLHDFTIATQIGQGRRGVLPRVPQPLDLHQIASLGAAPMAADAEYLKQLPLPLATLWLPEGTAAAMGIPVRLDQLGHIQLELGLPLPRRLVASCPLDLEEHLGPAYALDGSVREEATDLPLLAGLCAGIVISEGDAGHGTLTRSEISKLNLWEHGQGHKVNSLGLGPGLGAWHLVPRPSFSSGSFWVAGWEQWEERR